MVSILKPCQKEGVEMKTNVAGKNGMRMAAVLLCSVALALPALAQSGTTASGGQDQSQGPPPGGGPGGRRGGGPEQRLEMMTKELSLTPDQVAKIKPILEDGRKQMMALRDAGGAQEDRRAKMMELQKSESTQIKAVLSEDQKPKFEAMEARQRERMRDRGDRGGNGGPPPQAPPAPPQQ
jgi:periplasmic protein CpxP/Spy